MPLSNKEGLSFTQYSQIEKQGEIAGKLGMLHEEFKARILDHETRLTKLENSIVKQTIYVAILIGGLLFLGNAIIPTILQKIIGGVVK